MNFTEAIQGGQPVQRPSWDENYIELEKSGDFLVYHVFSEGEQPWPSEEEFAATDWQPAILIE